MSPRRTRPSFWPLVLVAAVAAMFAGPAAHAEDPDHGGPPPHAKGKGGVHAGARHQAAWKAQRTTGRNPNVIEVGCWAHARRYFFKARAPSSATCRGAPRRPEARMARRMQSRRGNESRGVDRR